MTNRAKNWTEWSGTILRWINDLSKEEDKDNTSITQQGTIIPDVLLSTMPEYMKCISLQINASYESNLFDCTAVMMRRLLEVLLILTYQNEGLESEIMDISGRYYIRLDKIIRDAQQNIKLSLSANTRNDMDTFKDLGNYSAHKIWYSCTQQDIQKHLLKYRALIEELLYKAGMKQ